MAKPEKDEKIKVYMLRETRGEKVPEGERFPEKLEKHKTYTVSLKFGRWLIWKKKAREATPEDGAKVKKKGPIDTEDLPSADKAKGK